MRTTNSAVKADIQRYINHGFSIDDACFQVNSATLGRHTIAIEQVKKELKAD